MMSVFLRMNASSLPFGYLRLDEREGSYSRRLTALTVYKERVGWVGEGGAELLTKPRRKMKQEREIMAVEIMCWVAEGIGRGESELTQ